MALDASSIYLSFVWKGISRTSDGNPHSKKYEIGVDRVNLVFENARSKVTVEIPKDLKAGTSNKLSFSMTKDNQTKKHDVLKVSIQKMSKVSIVVVFFNYSDNPDIQKEIDKLNKTESFGGLDFNMIELQIPEKLESGKHYQLKSGKHYQLKMCADENLFLSATTLLKPEDVHQIEPKKEKVDVKKESKKQPTEAYLIDKEKYEALFGNYLKTVFEQRRKP